MKTKLDFVTGNTRRSLLAMALPLLGAMVLNMAYNLVDSLWVGNLLGAQATAALAAATPLILLLTSLAMGMTNGVSILLSQAVGAKDETGIRRITSTSLALCILLAVCLAGGAELALPQLLTLLQTPAAAFSMAQSYLAIYLVGYLPVFLYCYFTAVLRSFGNAWFQLAAMLASTLLNTVLDPIFIHWLGFAGAAVATVTSQVICLVLMVTYLVHKKLFAVRPSGWSARYAGAFFAKGLPSAFQQSIPALSTAFITSLVGGWGIEALAAYGVANRLETLLFYPAMALNMVLTTIVGQCAGAHRVDRARDYLRQSLWGGGVLLAVLSVPVVLFAPQLALLFVKNQAVATIVGGYFSVVSVGYVLNTLTNCLLGTVNGLGAPAKSMWCMVLYYIIIRMPLAYLLAKLGFGLGGIWVAVLASHAVAALAAAFLAAALLRRGGTEPAKQGLPSVRHEA